MESDSGDERVALGEDAFPAGCAVVYARKLVGIYAQRVIAHYEHPSKAATWRRGEFVVLPDAEAEDCTVWFAASDDTDGNVGWEGLLCNRLSPDRARVCAVPFWLFDIGLGDEVAVIDSPDGALLADGVAHDAGNFTFRVIFEGAREDDERWQALMIDLEPQACWFDVKDRAFVALSAPPDSAEVVADYLAAREQRNELHYETGRSSFPQPG
jgi:hypothetical protein